MDGGGGVGADCAYLGQGSAAQTCNLSQGPARGRVCFCSSGGRLVPGIGGSVSACFLYIAASCSCKMPPLHADCCLLHKLAAVIVEKSRAQWNPDIQKYGRPASLVQEKVMFATVKAHVVSNCLPHGPKHIFVCNYAASQGGYRAPTRSLQEPRTASISHARGITRHRRGVLPS